MRIAMKTQKILQYVFYLVLGINCNVLKYNNIKIFKCNSRIEILILNTYITMKYKYMIYSYNVTAVYLLLNVMCKSKDLKKPLCSVVFPLT